MSTGQKKSDKAISAYPAGGIITVVGVGIYYLTARFLGDVVGSGKEVHLTADGVGEFADISETELAGFFYQNPSDYIGSCEYTLEEIDFEEGVMRLLIYSSDGNTKIGAFYGLSEGFGEAFAHKKKGSLSAYPSVYDNKFNFEGNDDISTITFLYSGDYSLTDGQQFDGVTVSPINGKANQIEIDFKAGREPSEKCADYYKAYVDDEKDNMIHTEGGDHAPNELNFAFKGTLTINGTAFNICLGQGDHDGSHNWHLCSTSVDADNNGKDGDIGSYRLEQSGSHTFKVSLDD